MTSSRDGGRTIHQFFQDAERSGCRSSRGSSPTAVGRSTVASATVVYRSGMNATDLPPDRLAAMPLWRLLVLLEDVEREHGPSCPTARAVARIVATRLRTERRTPAAEATPNNPEVARG